ncbi:uncharacterized protein LOC142541866 [Primulina tabacum]|uniref:uncharacterized protein LOC142541866 n=1 Tax=Primulina tabacum TaxID=48773 RepID=UPI003F59DA8D
MDLDFLKWRLLRGSLVRRVVMRAFMLVVALMLVSLVQIVRVFRVVEPKMPSFDECPLNLNSSPSVNFTGFLNFAPGFALPQFRASATGVRDSETVSKAMFKLLMEKNFLSLNARALCVGEGFASDLMVLRELGYFNAVGVDIHPSFSLVKRRFVYALKFEDNHFDFVLSRGLDSVSVPSLLVLEIERVLRLGGTGAILLGSHQFYSGGSVRPFLSLLKSSNVVHMCKIGSFTLVIFIKGHENFASFEHFQLPSNCPSVKQNMPWIKNIEPLVDKNSKPSKPEFSYLPKFLNISSRNKLLYINIGAGEFAKSSITKMSKTYCSDHHTAFEVFIIDYKTSVLSSYVMDRGTTFVYHPALAGNAAATAPEISSDEFFSAPSDDEGFDIVQWFNETVTDDDFVVLMMNAKLVELNILVELFKTGLICRVDELFLRCSDGENCKKLCNSLRNSGVYAHQWSGD